MPCRPARLAPLLAAVLALGCALAGCGAGDDDAPPRAAAPSPTPNPAFRAAGDDAGPADRPAGRHLIARLARPVMLRSRPGGRMLHRVATRTEFGTRTSLGVVRRRGAWLEVVAPQLENGETAWIPAANARLRGTDYSILIDRSARRLTLRHDGRVRRRISVAVGRPGTPTPLGRFAVTDLLRPERADSPYGCCILALSGRQTKLVEGWPGGDRLAIHHTPASESIGRAASLGCLRGSRRDLEHLIARVPVGTPVTIRA